MTARIGSLFSGYGGLDMGVVSVLDADVAWHVEWDKAPSKILDYHWPDVPNYGDVTAVDWSAVEPVDILTGGFPCQDVSLAGRRAGMSEGTRSGLWSEFARAIDVLRPQLVVIENVRGLLSATANSDMEPCTWCVGEKSGEPTLRALGAVLGDLADLGYDASWCGLRAADVGAPHGRFRVFVLAQLADTSSGRSGVQSGGTGSHEACGVGVRVAHRDSRLLPVENADLAAGGQRRVATPGQAKGGRARADIGRRGGASAFHADCVGWDGRAEESERGIVRTATAGNQTVVADTDWGQYAPAVRRWEATTSRIAPPPTVPDGREGNHRLSALFVEWMMGLNAGHVTDAGLTRNEQLRALGNGVVPLQAAAAVRYLLTSVNAGMTVGRSA